jgi:hypothetical protein
MGDVDPTARYSDAADGGRGGESEERDGPTASAAVAGGGGGGAGAGAGAGADPASAPVAFPLATEALVAQRLRWPATGSVVLAQYTADTVVVYQAYRREIASYAVAHGHFGGPHFSFTRMSWIKPNFMVRRPRAHPLHVCACMCVAGRGTAHGTQLLRLPGLLRKRCRRGGHWREGG